MKFSFGYGKVDAVVSPPTRGVWIEISKTIDTLRNVWVTPHAGGVD